MARACMFEIPALLNMRSAHEDSVQYLWRRELAAQLTLEEAREPFRRLLGLTFFSTRMQRRFG